MAQKKVRHEQVDVGISPDQLVKLDSLGRLPAVDGSLLTGVSGGDIVDDLTPQLGGDLDPNGFDILGLSSATPPNFSVKPGDISTGSTTGANLTFTAGGILSAATSINAGNVTITGGTNQNTLGTANGGQAILRGGDAVGSAFGTGGAVTISGGDGTQNGGSVQIQAGRDTTDSSSPGSITFGGTGTGIVPDVKFLEDSTNGTNYVALKVPSAIATNRTWILPVDDPSTVAGQFLTTDASGVLSFDPASAVAALNDLTDVVITGSPAAVSGEVLKFNGTNWINDTDSGLFTEDANRNIVGGTNAGSALTTGTDNFLAGYHAGDGVTDGFDNIYIGTDSGNLATTGDYNVGIGVRAVSGTASADFTGNRNIGIGFDALADIRGTTNANTAIGHQAGFNIINGSQNTILGSQAGGNLNNGSGNIIIGDTAGPSSNQSGKLFIDTTTTDTPLIGGDFLANTVTINDTLNVATELQIGGSAFDLNNLADVIVAGSPLVADQVLTFNGTNWVNAEATGGEPYVAINSSGAGPTATGTDGIAIGDTASVGAAGTDGIAIGNTPNANGIRSIAIGSNTLATGTNDIVAGYGAYTAGTSTGSLVLGNACRALKTYQVCVGNELQGTQTTVDYDYSGKFGTRVSPTEENFLHIFQKGKLELYGSEAQFIIPTYAVGGSPTNYPASFEGGLIFDSVNNVLKVYDGASWGDVSPAGSSISILGDLSDVDVTGSPAATNGDVLRYNGTTWFNDSETASKNWIVGNAGNDFGTAPTAVGSDAISIGDAATAGGAISIAIGDTANAPSSNAIAIGRNTNASGSVSIAIGYGADATVQSATAIGHQCYARGTYSIAIGARSVESDGSYGIAIGHNSDIGASGTNSITIGHNANAQSATCVIVGYNSISSAINQTIIGPELTSADVTSDVAYSLKVGCGTTGQHNFIHLHSRGKLELHGDEAQYIFPDYPVGGSPTNYPANAVEGGVVYDSINKGLRIYDGATWNDVGGGIKNVVEDTTPQLGGDLDVNGYNIITPALVGAGTAGPINIISGNAPDSGGYGSNIALTSGNGAWAGGTIDITTGDCTSGKAGHLTLQAGQSNLSGSYGGGNVSIFGGANAHASGTGGYVQIAGAAQTTGTGNGGDVWIDGGTSAGGYGGAVIIHAGASTTGTPGKLSLLAGNANTSNTNNGGDVFIGAGSAQVGYTGGNVVLEPGGRFGDSGTVAIHTATLSTGQATVQLWDDTNTAHTTGNYVALKAPAFAGSPLTNITFVLPELDGSNGDVLQTDGTGNLSFGTISSATETTEGLIELATQDEVNTGTDTTRAVTPATLQEKAEDTALLMSIIYGI